MKVTANVSAKAIDWVQVFILIVLIAILPRLSIEAAERYSDPDGCFSCHALKGLQYIDQQGVLRDASIDQSHYYSSLHGSVPCKDCHRQIRYYPHKPENGAVDCGESCHVNEPSNGEAFTHQEVVKAFNDSVHGEGAYKGFTGANRLTEMNHEQNPSCRKCHQNSAYIETDQLDKFMEAFQHTNAECGTCHQGEAWRNQLSGHILRRFIGARWKKSESNQICNECHADIPRMQEAMVSTVKSQEKHPSSFRWQQASHSYAKTLHSRILVTGDESGASCLDCHAPPGEGMRHGLMNALNPQSSTHTDNLANTCAQSDCHQFAQHPSNQSFVVTDMHSMDQLPVQLTQLMQPEKITSFWYRAGIVFAVLCLILLAGQLSRMLLRRYPLTDEPLLGSDRFKQNILGKPQKKPSKATSKGKQKSVQKTSSRKTSSRKNSAQKNTDRNHIKKSASKRDKTEEPRKK